MEIYVFISSGIEFNLKRTQDHKRPYIFAMVRSQANEQIGLNYDASRCRHNLMKKCGVAIARNGDRKKNGVNGSFPRFVLP